jgi:flagellar capping protein FliD
VSEDGYSVSTTSAKGALVTITTREIRETQKVIREHLELASEHQARAADQELDTDTRLMHHAQSVHATNVALANYEPMLEKTIALAQDLEMAQDRFVDQYNRMKEVEDRINKQREAIEGFFHSIESNNVQMHRLFDGLTDVIKNLTMAYSEVQPLVEERKVRIANRGQ